MSRRFEDRVALVTGAGYGIGKAIALGFGREGAHVVLAARSKEKMERVAEELSALGTRPLVRPTDVGREEEVGAMVSGVLGRYGRIDVLVSNAGIAGPAGLARDIAPEDWERTIAVNLSGAFFCAKHV